MAAATSSSCSSFFTLRSPNAVEPRVRHSSSSSSSQGSSSGGCGKLDGVAMWFLNGVTMAFFASLNRCSCIRIATEEDGDEDANDLPLMFNDGNLRHDGGAASASGSTTSRRWTGKGKKSAC